MSSHDDPPETYQWGVGYRTSSYGYAGTLNMTDEEKEQAKLREKKRQEDGWHFGFVNNSAPSTDS